MRNLIKAVYAELKRCWTRIRQSGSTERTRELESARTWAEQARAALETEQAHVRAEAGELESAWFAQKPLDTTPVPRAHFYHTWAAWGCTLGGWCTTALEMVFAGGLSVLLLALSWQAAALVGIIITLLMAIALKGVITPLVIGRYADRPKAGRDLALRLLYLTVPVTLLLLAAVFIVRAEAGWLAASLFAWATGALAILCPVIAAALFVLGTLYDWSRRLAEEYRVLEHLKGEVIELRDYCTRELSREAFAPVVAPASLAPLARVGMVALFVGIATLSGACLTAAAPTTAPTPGPALDGEQWDDTTSSVDPVDLAQARGAIREVVTDLAQQGVLRRWRVAAFGEHPWSTTPYHEAVWTKFEPRACAAPSEAARIFKTHGEVEGSLCAQERDQARAAHKAHIAETLDALRAAVEQHRPAASRCTSLADLLLRVVQTADPRLVLITTDGLETCRPTGLPTIPAPGPGVRVIVIMVRSHALSEGGTVEQQYAQRRARLLERAPWLSVLAPWDLRTAIRSNGPLPATDTR